jgi:hypothetical protein
MSILPAGSAAPGVQVIGLGSLVYPLYQKDPGPWFAPTFSVLAPVTYWIAGNADYNNGGAGPDAGVRITATPYLNGVDIVLDCDDYGGPNAPDFDFNDKIIEIFIPLVYGEDYSQITINGIGPNNAPPQVIIK